MAVLIGFSLVTFVIILLWRARAAIRAASAYVGPASQDKSAGEYHAVHLQFCEETACEPVRRHDGERFLASEAPALPLVDCDARECRCRYSHYDDRRKIMGRRAVDNGFDAQPYRGPERRAGPELTRGRRKSDPGTSGD